MYKYAYGYLACTVTGAFIVAKMIPDGSVQKLNRMHLWSKDNSVTITYRRTSHVTRTFHSGKIWYAEEVVESLWASLLRMSLSISPISRQFIKHSCWFDPFQCHVHGNSNLHLNCAAQKNVSGISLPFPFLPANFWFTLLLSLSASWCLVVYATKEYSDGMGLWHFLRKELSTTVNSRDESIDRWPAPILLLPIWLATP